MEGTVSGQPLGRHLVVLADFEVLHMLILALGKQRHRSLSMYVIPPVESSDNNAITLLLTLPFYQVTGGVAEERAARTELSGAQAMVDFLLLC